MLNSLKQPTTTRTTRHRRTRKEPTKQADISRTVEVLYVQQRNSRDPPIIITNDQFGNNMIDLTKSSRDHDYYNDTYSWSNTKCNRLFKYTQNYTKSQFIESMIVMNLMTKQVIRRPMRRASPQLHCFQINWRHCSSLMQPTSTLLSSSSFSSFSYFIFSLFVKAKNDKLNWQLLLCPLQSTSRAF